MTSGTIRLHGANTRRLGLGGGGPASELVCRSMRDPASAGAIGRGTGTRSTFGGAVSGRARRPPADWFPQQRIATTRLCNARGCLKYLQYCAKEPTTAIRPNRIYPSPLRIPESYATQPIV